MVNTGFTQPNYCIICPQSKSPKAHCPLLKPIITSYNNRGCYKIVVRKIISSYEGRTMDEGLKQTGVFIEWIHLSYIIFVESMGIVQCYCCGTQSPCMRFFACDCDREYFTWFLKYTLDIPYMKVTKCKASFSQGRLYRASREVLQDAIHIMWPGYYSHGDHVWRRKMM